MLDSEVECGDSVVECGDSEVECGVTQSASLSGLKVSGDGEPFVSRIETCRKPLERKRRGWGIDHSHRKAWRHSTKDDPDKSSF